MAWASTALLAKLDSSQTLAKTLLSKAMDVLEHFKGHIKHCVQERRLHCHVKSAHQEHIHLDSV